MKQLGIASTLPAVPFVPRADRSPRVLHLASPFAHKGTAFTIASMTRYFVEHDDDLRLLLIGRLPLGITVDHPRIEHRSDPITNSDMSVLMSTSRALLFPSSIEGYGLPPVEAWLYGTPSLYGAAPSLEEMDLDIPGHLTERSHAVFSEALAAILPLDDAELIRLRDAVASAANPKELAARVLGVYREQSPR